MLGIVMFLQNHASELGWPSGRISGHRKFRAWWANQAWDPEELQNLAGFRLRDWLDPQNSACGNKTLSSTTRGRERQQEEEGPDCNCCVAGATNYNTKTREKIPSCNTVVYNIWKLMKKTHCSWGSILARWLGFGSSAHWFDRSLLSSPAAGRQRQASDLVDFTRIIMSKRNYSHVHMLKK